MMISRFRNVRTVNRGVLGGTTISSSEQESATGECTTSSVLGKLHQL